jgi:hypothetical protein
MVSLKMSPAASKAEAAGPEDLEYPWGTRLTLTDEQAKSLFPVMPKIGATVSLDAEATVSSVNIVQQQGGGTRVSIELQITEMEVEDPGETEVESTASKIYGKDGPKGSE